MMRHNLVRCFGVATLAGFALLVGAPAASAQPPQWHYHVTKPDGMRHAFVEQKASDLGEHCSTRLQFWASQDLGKDALGSLALDLTVSPVHLCSFKGFDFDHFVDEDGHASNQTFIRVTVFRGSKRFVHRFGVYGLYEYNDEDPYSGYTGMTFETNNLIDNKHSPMRKLVDQLLKGADRIEIAVIDGKNHATLFSGTFPLAGSKPPLAAMLKGL